nr:MAG TPA: hypothetical protein [Caudoviricetes sp.]
MVYVHFVKILYFNSLTTNKLCDIIIIVPKGSTKCVA